MRAWLGLGGNLGQPEQAMAAALQRLDRSAGSVAAVSRLYRTPPWGVTDQPDFLNCCAVLDTPLSPRALLDRCLETERGLARVRDRRWGPRTIDIDIVAIEGVELQDEALTLPHPEAHRRAFVLVPLLDIAPTASLSGRPLTVWLAELDASGIRAASENGDWWRSEAPAMRGV